MKRVHDRRRTRWGQERRHRVGNKSGPELLNLSIEEVKEGRAQTVSRNINQQSRPACPIKESIKGGPELVRVLTLTRNERAKVKTFEQVRSLETRRSCFLNLARSAAFFVFLKIISR